MFPREDYRGLHDQNRPSGIFQNKVPRIFGNSHIISWLYGVLIRCDTPVFGFCRVARLSNVEVSDTPHHTNHVHGMLREKCFFMMDKAGSSRTTRATVRSCRQRGPGGNIGILGAFRIRIFLHSAPTEANNLSFSGPQNGTP